MCEKQANGLQERLSGIGLYLFILGDTLGAGIYALIGTMIETSGGAIWLPMLGAMGIVLLTAISYGQLVSKYPSSAGVAGFAEKAFKNSWFTFIVGFCLFCSTVGCAASLVSAFSGTYLQELVAVPQHVVIPLLIIVIMLVCIRGVGLVEKANMIMVMVKVFGLTLIISLALFILLQGGGNPEQLLRLRTDASPSLVVLSATSLAMFAFIGFEGSASMAEEVKDVRRVYPKALLASLATSGLIYLIFGVCVSAVLPAGSAGRSDGPLLEILRLSNAGIPPSVFSFIALIAVVNGAILSTLVASRMLYGLSKQKKFPLVISEKVTKSGSPWLAIMVTSIGTYVLCMSADLKLIAELVVILVLLIFTLTNICSFATRHDIIPEQRFFVPAWVSLLGAMGCISLLTQQRGETWLRVSIMAVVGILLYVLSVRRRSLAPS